VLLRDVQMHPWKHEVLHIDFQRVDAKQKIHMRVPLHFINEEIAPGVKLGGGVVNHIMTELEVSCLPGDLPEYLEVDLAALELGDSVHLSEVKLPSGVESVQLGRGDDSVVVSVQVPRVVSETEEAAEGAEEVEAGAAESPAPEASAEEEK
jgi:large subunit ribosomal protein L25